jgi:hypothetical protein
MLPDPQEAAEPTASATPSSGTSSARPVAITPMPANATAAPTQRRAPGRSPSTPTATPIVKKTCSCTISDASPAGRPRSMPTKSSPNWTALMNRPTSRTHLTAIGGRRRKRIAGNATNVKRSAANSSGGKSSRPQWMTTKFRPQTRTIPSARRRWGRGT